jgi:two-component system, LuxR family, response regulator FixJ
MSILERLGSAGWWRQEGDRMADALLVHIVDDDPAVRDSLAMLLQSAGMGVRVYDSAVALLSVASKLDAGCVLTDVRMPEIDGLTLQRQLVALNPRLTVVVMTGHADVPIAVQALKAGARDFLEKPFDDERLIGVVKEALAASQQARQINDAAESTVARLATLTHREREVLERLMEGQPNKTIAYELGTSPRTVEVQRARVMEKMGARSLAELVRMVLAVDRPAANQVVRLT